MSTVTFSTNCNRFVKTGFRSQIAVQPDFNRFNRNQNQKNTNNAGWKYRNKEIT